MTCEISEMLDSRTPDVYQRADWHAVERDNARLPGPGAVQFGCSFLKRDPSVIVAPTLQTVWTSNEMLVSGGRRVSSQGRMIITMQQA